MILRRLTQHIREQNWFAVGLDFIIVVVGIFVGLQVSQWSASQADRAQEHVILERMHSEIVSLVEVRQSNAAGQEQDLERMVSVFPALTADSEIESLSGEQCRAVIISHIYSMPTPSLVVIDEMESTGGLQLITSAELRESILKYTRAGREAMRLLGGVTVEPFHLASRHSELIEITISAQLDRQDPIFDNDPVCDLVGMRQSRIFRNDFADNVSRNLAVVSIGNTGMLMELQNLHAALDEVLGISHEDTQPS